MTAVTRIEATLSELEAIIDRGKQTFVEVGNALTEIRERKLYRDAGYSTFEDYCQVRHGFSASRGRQLIAAAATVTAVTLSGGTPPATEREARALAAAQRAYEAEAAGRPAPIVRSVLDAEYDATRALVRDLAAEVGAGDADAIDGAVEELILKVAAREYVRTGSIPTPPPWWEWTYPSTHAAHKRKPRIRNATRDASNRLVTWEIEVEIQAGRFFKWCEGAGINLFAKARKGETVFAEQLRYPCEVDSPEAVGLARLIAEEGEEAEHTAAIGEYYHFMLRPDELAGMAGTAA